MSHISLTYHIIWRTHRSERTTVIEYIKNQKVHHHKATFREEYENLLREFGLDPEKDLFLKD